MQLEDLCQHPRVRVRKAGEPNPQGRVVVYWMQRAQRAADNPALDVAIHAANALGKPLVVLLTLVPFYPGANLRHYAFMAAGLGELADDLGKRGIGFVLRCYPHHSAQRGVEPAVERRKHGACQGKDGPYAPADQYRDAAEPGRDRDQRRALAAGLRPPLYSRVRTGLARVRCR